MSWDSNQYGTYRPSLPLTATAAFSFLLLSGVHVTASILRKRLFGIPLVTAGLASSAGFGCRLYSRYYLGASTPYNVQLLMILLAPILYFAAVIMFFSPLCDSQRMARKTKEASGWINITTVMAFTNLLSLIVQGAGAYRMVSPVGGQDSGPGERIVMAGIVLQVLSILLFMFTTVKFGRGHETADLKVPRLGSKLLITVQAANFLMLVRDLANIVNLGMGDSGYLRTRDWPVYAFDALPMGAIMILALAWHSADITTRDEDRYAMSLPAGPKNEELVKAKQDRLMAIAEFRAMKSKPRVAEQAVPAS